jgi:hypothetical protein
LAAEAGLEDGLEEGEVFGAPKKDVMEPFALGFFAASLRGTLEALRFRADMIMIVREKRRRDSLKCEWDVKRSVFLRESDVGMVEKVKGNERGWS